LGISIGIVPVIAMLAFVSVWIPVVLGIIGLILLGISIIETV
jgi:hypothetical protein